MLRFSAFRILLVDNAQAEDSCGYFIYFTLPCNTLMVHAHTVVSILLPTLIIEQEH